jgi:hypothetical protein
MRLTFATVALVSWLGMSGFSDPFWTFLEAFWSSSGTLEKEGATADPNGLAAPEGANADPDGVAAPAGATADPDGLTGTAPAGGGADPNG